MQTSSHKLQSAYIREVMSGLRKMKRALRELRNGSESRALLAELQVTAKFISDLAMIHGYNGTESIARKVYTTLRHLPASTVTSSNFLSKIALAINGIQDVAFMEDCIEEKLKVEKIIKKEVIAANLNQAPSSQEIQASHKMTEVNENQSIMFDIQEPDSFKKLCKFP